MSSRYHLGLNAHLHQKTERFLAEFDVGWTEQAFVNSARSRPFSDEEVRQAVRLLGSDREQLAQNSDAEKAVLIANQ